MVRKYGIDEGGVIVWVVCTPQSSARYRRARPFNRSMIERHRVTV